MATPGRDDQHSTTEGLYDLLHDSCRDLIAAGRIDREAYRRFMMPLYFRSVDELAAPVKSPGFLSEQFEVENAVAELVVTPFLVEYDETGELDRYVERYVGFMQAFTEPVIRARPLPANARGWLKPSTIVPKSALHCSPRVIAFAIFRPLCRW